jgi:hypothetical protein
VRPLSCVLGVAVVAVVLWDTFETVVLPRRVTRRFRITNAFYRLTWSGWSAVGRRLHGARDAFLSYYGPLSLFALLTAWATGLTVGFALLQNGLATDMGAHAHAHAHAAAESFTTYLYFSGTTFFTLGLGDLAPASGAGRAVTVAEAGMGFAFLAIVISYLPVLYQAFSRREVFISQLDARAGSPPTAGTLLSREAGADLALLLRSWELWSAELLEACLSYPVLAFYRSQHDRESWLAALTALLDTCALIVSGVADGPLRAAELAFAMARHASVDLTQVLRVQVQMPDDGGTPLLTRDGLSRELTAHTRLSELRALYEPYVGALADVLLTPLPAWRAPENAEPDDWASSPGRER